MPRWLLPSVGFLLVLGSTGITVKLALKYVQWPTIFGWTSFAYLITLGILAIGTGIHFEFTAPAKGTFLAILSGLGAATSFMLLNVALSRGQATQVIPIASAYPVVTTVLAILILRESLTQARITGIALVVLGLITLGISDR